MTSVLGRARTAGAMRVRDWAFPAPPVEREVLHAEPAGGGSDDRPPLLFVHGLEHAAWCWAESWLPRAADAGWSAYAVSVRAHGESGGADRRWRIRLSEYEHDVLQAASGLPRPPVVVAHSLGTVVAARVAARYPFAAVVLLTPPGVTQGVGTLLHNLRRKPMLVLRMTAGQPAHLAADDLFATLDRDRAAEYVSRLEPEPPIVQYQLAFHTPPGQPVNGAPVLVYGAQEDTLVPAGDVERTATYYGVPVRWLPAIGHDVMLDAGNEQVLDTVLADIAEALDLAG